MDEPYLFISYKHGDPSTKIAKRFYDRLDVVSEGLGFQLFMDDKLISGGDQWSMEVEQALHRTTHFIALLNDDYWLSKECRRELRHALIRFEKSGTPRLLFVLAEQMRPELLSFDKDRKTGALTSDDPKVGKVGDLHFLGPFDEHLRLVRLDWQDPGKLSDQLAQLVDRLEKTLPRPSSR
jgi:TIR domain